jgi:hypothetical protein
MHQNLFITFHPPGAVHEKVYPETASISPQGFLHPWTSFCNQISCRNDLNPVKVSKSYRWKDQNRGGLYGQIKTTGSCVYHIVSIGLGENQERETATVSESPENRTQDPEETG